MCKSQLDRLDECFGDLLQGMLHAYHYRLCTDIRTKRQEIRCAGSDINLVHQ